MLNEKPISNLLDMLRRAALMRPERGLRFFRSGKEVEFLTFKRLLLDAGRMGIGLREHAGVTPGERVALVLATSPDCVRALFGILAAGAVPVPLPPPMPFSGPLRYAERVRGALQRSQIRLLVGDESQDWYLKQVAGALEQQVRPLNTKEILGTGTSCLAVSADSPALVQYTSGSTSFPKGVVLTHRQVLANLEAISKGLRITDEDVGCFWLPLFHDMGLIGGLLATIHSGCDAIFMPPEDYVMNPKGWLEMFGRYKVTISAAPNAAYLHCVKRISPEAVAKLDLSTWRAALNGAEMVDAATMREFAEHFRPAGFRKEAVMPVYGMAEAALAVAFSPVEEGLKSIWLRRSALQRDWVDIVPAEHPEGKEIVALGGAVNDMEVRVVGEGGAPIEQAKIGEIQIRGGSVMCGYDRNVEATEAVLRDGWLSTGDLGFVHEGRLYVTGRRKEVIIVRGENYYATDIENLACKAKGVTPNGALAIGVASEGTEGVVLLVETRGEDAEGHLRLAAEVRGAVSTSLGISPSEILMVRRGELPRTSSGKPERHKGPELYRRLKAAQVGE